MDIGHIIPHIEALLFASDKPLTPIDMTELINNAFGFMEDKITMEQIQTSLEGIVEKYKSEFYPFEVRESGGGWQFLTKKDFHKTVAQLNGEKFLKRLSNAALETLAIIAYKQPITKADIEGIRGVNCDYSIQKLLEKELIVISGRNEELPGKPLIYNTSRNFMDYFGINSPADLPKLKEIFSDTMVDPTIVNNENAADGPVEAIHTPTEEEMSDISPLVVTPEGELLEEPQDAEMDELGDGETTNEAFSDEEGDELVDEETENNEPAEEETEASDDEEMEIDESEKEETDEPIDEETENNESEEEETEASDDEEMDELGDEEMEDHTPDDEETDEPGNEEKK